MKRGLWILIFLCAPLLAAQAETPRLRDMVTIRSATISLADLLEGVDLQTPVFMAPAPGTTGTIRAQRVKEAALQAGLTDIDLRALAHVSVTRIARAMDAKAVSDDIQNALADRLKLPVTSLDVQFDQALNTTALLLPDDATLIAELTLDPVARRFTASLDPQRPAHERPIITGRYRELVETAVLKKPLTRGETITEDHITLEKRPRHDSSETMPLAATLGLIAKTNMVIGQPLRAQDVTKPILVERNSLVTVSFQIPGMALQLRGRAQDQGALGDAISILNPVSKKIVVGIVTGPGRASVNPEQQEMKP